MRPRYRSITRGSLVAAALSMVLGACGGGSESNSTNTAPTPTEVSQTATPSVSATLGADTIVGGWKRAFTCQGLVRALRQAGLEDQAGFEDFVAELVGAAELLTTPENVPATDPKHPCADAAAEPRENTLRFWEDGTLNAYGPDGKERGEGEYAIVDPDTILFAGVHVDYKIDGDTMVFSIVVPNSCTSKPGQHFEVGGGEGCASRAANAIASLLPGETWKRVS